jgi:hypothetical protein
VAEFAKWKSAPTPTPITMKTLSQAWEAISKASARPMIRYVGSEEYAVYCVIAFLEWGAE